MLLWRAAFWHVGTAYSRTMIRGAFAVVKGGFSRVSHDGGIPAYAGMTGGDGEWRGWETGMRGYDVMGVRVRRRMAGFPPTRE